MSSTKRTPEHPGLARNWPGEAVVAAAEGAAAEGAAAVEGAVAAAVAAACRRELAASVRLEHFPNTLMDAGRHGRA